MRLIACFLASLLPITFLIFIPLWLHFLGGGYDFHQGVLTNVTWLRSHCFTSPYPFHTVNLIFADFCWLSFPTMMFNLNYFLPVHWEAQSLNFGIDLEAVTINHNFIVNSWSFQILSSAFWLPYWLFFFLTFINFIILMIL